MLNNYKLIDKCDFTCLSDVTNANFLTIILWQFLKFKLTVTCTFFERMELYTNYW